MIKYTGPLGGSKMPKKVRAAYTSWCDQRARCNQKTNKSYKYYGAKGLKVAYSSRDFVNWWLLEASKNKNLKGTLCCERIDHNKGYNFENIKLGNFVTNALEAFDRSIGKVRVKVAIFNSSGALIGRFNSATEAAEFAGTTSTTVVAQCKGRYKSSKSGLIFKYET